jgi:uncharacterized protein
MPNDNAVSYLEIGSQDADSSKDFFAKVLGWKFNPTGDNGQGWFQTPTIRAGLHGGNPEPQLYVFFAVPDLLVAVEAVKAAGGQADELGPDEPGFGRFCSCRDPQGIRFGLHQRPKS